MFNGPNYMPYPTHISKPSLFQAFRSLNFSEILNGTQKTLNVINQAIPIFYQIRPLWNNTKTIFRIANAVNKPDDNINDSNNGNNRNNKSNNTSNNNSNSPNPNSKVNATTNKNYNEPTFFI